jgi:phage terminase small subunit
MPVLANSKDEHFAQAVAKGESATKSYVSAGYSPKGAQRPAARML